MDVTLTASPSVAYDTIPKILDTDLGPSKKFDRWVLNFFLILLLLSEFGSQPTPSSTLNTCAKEALDGHSVATSVAEPKLFIFGSGSDFDHNFGFGSSYSHILALQIVL